MQTNIVAPFKDTPEGQEAEAIVRKCVHCGFCLATCPTYQLLGDELDSPRGRIYLMKQVREGAPVTARTQLHLDRCLTCRNCETTCPSGVEYGRLVDIGRGLVEQRVPRPLAEKLKRKALSAVLPKESVFAPLLKLGQLARPLLPAALKQKVPSTAATPAAAWPAARHARRMLVLEGCVQPTLAPSINAATARLLDRCGISLIKSEQAGCCGALDYHLNQHESGLNYMRRNIDAWWPHVEAGVEAIVITASGCGATVKEYGHLLRRDPRYKDKAARVSTLMRDIAEVVTQERDKLIALAQPASTKVKRRLAFHPPCSLQHGLKLRNVVEPLLKAAGFELTYVADAHLCCGSAGTYSILQPELSQRLLRNKIAALQAGDADAIVTANIGCQTHLQSAAQRPVRHWVEVLEEQLALSANARA
jgi:glycolate oxidase iron-sulfur subunit